MFFRSEFGPGTVVVDDVNPDVLYTCSGSQSWFIGGALGLEFNGTTHGTSSASCTFTYTFSGTSIAVYGTIPGYYTDSPTAGATSQYFIDDSTVPTKVFIANPGVNAVYQQLFFQSDSNLSDGTHSLTVTLAEDSVVAGHDGFWIDFFVITPGSTTPSATTPNSAVTATVTITSGHGKGSSVSTDAVLGGVLGGVLLLIVLLGVAYLFRRRRRRTDPAENGLKQEVLPFLPPNDTTISPFTLTSPTHNQSRSSLPTSTNPLPSTTTSEPRTLERATQVSVPSIRMSQLPPPY